MEKHLATMGRDGTAKARKVIEKALQSADEAYGKVKASWEAGRKSALITSRDKKGMAPRSDNQRED